MARAAVVTGANKGLGLAIVRGLCKRFKGDVYLTSRDENRGQKAIALLEKENLHPNYCQVDVTNKESIVKLKEMLLSEYGGLDLLVNNAGVYAEGIPTPKKLDMMMGINYFGVVSTCENLFPILKKGARVVHVSSSGGNYALAESKQLIQEMDSANSVEDITELMQAFVTDAKDNTWEKKGWCNSAYAISKAGVIMITKIQQKMFDGLPNKPGIIVNACCPGLLDTDILQEVSHRPDMTLMTPDEGADTPLYLALLPESTESPKGCFCREKQIFACNNDPLVDIVRKLEEEKTK